MRSVKINGEVLPQAEVRLQAANLRMEREAGGRQLSLGERLALQEEATQLLIDRLLILQEARRLAFVPNPAEVDAALSQLARRFDGVAGCRAGADTPASREEIGRRIMIDKVISHWRASARRPRTAELQEHYRKHKQQFHAPEMVHASHIVRQFEGAANPEDLPLEIQNLRGRVAAGEEFGRVATQHSDCPENNGDLGWFARGVMVEEFDSVLFTAPISELTSVFRTEFGFHFAIVHARKPAGIRPFDEVRPMLEESLWLASQDQAVGRALAELQAKAVIGSEA